MTAKSFNIHSYPNYRDTFSFYLLKDHLVLNSGTLRADRVIPEGPLRIRDVSALLPMLDPV